MPEVNGGKGKKKKKKWGEAEKKGGPSEDCLGSDGTSQMVLHGKEKKKGD